MRAFIYVILLAFFLIQPCLAIYNFEEIPIEITAQGEIEGSVYTYGSYGLTNPPVDYKFTITGKPVWSKVYFGVWGGTQKYSGNAELSVNSIKKFKYSLYGEQDQNKNVYCTGYGVYWIAQDVSDILHSGENHIIVNTSRGESGNKMDGRVYGVFIVTAAEDSSGDITQYWISEGNANLHGEGWSGSNPTIHDSVSVDFQGADLTGAVSSELTTVLIASTRYQPDYLTFNSEELGIKISNNENYPDGATDIGDEISYNADGGTGIDSRYVDAEIFDVTNLLKKSNTVIFERGRDLNNDGKIDTSASLSEGEDYIHPVNAILAIKKKKTNLLKDLGINTITADNIYAGSKGVLTAEVRNYGGYTDEPITVLFYANNEQIGTDTINIGRSGIAYASVEWPAKTGEYKITAKTQYNGDSNPSNDEYSLNYAVENLPDLSLKISSPVKAGDEKTAAKESPVSFILAIPAIAAGAILFRKYFPKKIMPLFMICLILTCPIVIQPSYAAENSYSEYVLPVEIINTGGSVSSPVSLTVYIDGEKTAYKTLEDGISKGASETITISVFCTSGRHEIKIVADEDNSINETDENNNTAGGTYDFP